MDAFSVDSLSSPDKPIGLGEQGGGASNFATALEYSAPASPKTGAANRDDDDDDSGDDTDGEGLAELSKRFPATISCILGYTECLIRRWSKPDITSADHDDMYKKQSLPDVAFVYLNRMISLGDDRFTAGLSKSMNDTTIERAMQRDMTGYNNVCAILVHKKEEEESQDDEDEAAGGGSGKSKKRQKSEATMASPENFVNVHFNFCCKITAPQVITHEMGECVVATQPATPQCEASELRTDTPTPLPCAQARTPCGPPSTPQLPSSTSSWRRRRPGRRPKGSSAIETSASPCSRRPCSSSTPTWNGQRGLFWEETERDTVDSFCNAALIYANKPHIAKQVHSIVLPNMVAAARKRISAHMRGVAEHEKRWIEAARLGSLSHALKLENIDACVLTETRQIDDVLMAPLINHGWHVRHNTRANKNNGGVGLLLDSRWNEPEIIDTGHEDVICARISSQHTHTAYHLIGVYIPYGSTDHHADEVFRAIQQLCETLDNPVVMGDMNAHLPDRDEWWVNNPAVPEMQDIAPRNRPPRQPPADHRGKRLYRFASDNMMVMTNGRKDGSGRNPSAAVTYRTSNTATLIDYALLTPGQYDRCTSHVNIFTYNRAVATKHALLAITLRDDLTRPIPEPLPVPPPAPLPQPPPRKNPYRQSRSKQINQPQFQVPNNPPPAAVAAPKHQLANPPDPDSDFEEDAEQGAGPASAGEGSSSSAPPRPRQAPPRPTPDQRNKETKRKRKRKRARSKRVVFTDRYELPMHPEVRWKYAKASDNALTAWREAAFAKHVTDSKTHPQRAIDAATKGIAAAVMQAARSALQTREVNPDKAKGLHRSRPTYWSPELQMQYRALKHARKELRLVAIRGDPTEIDEAESEVHDQMNELLRIEREAIQAENNTKAAATEEDFAHGGTEATNYQGGGGYLKRAWDRLKGPLIRARKAKAALPNDMRNAEGTAAADPSESRRNWKMHGERLGKWTPDDPRYDKAFAREIQQQLDRISQKEDTMSQAQLQLLLAELMPPAADGSEDEDSDSGDEAQAVAAQIQANLQQQPPPRTRGRSEA